MKNGFDQKLFDLRKRIGTNVRIKREEKGFSQLRLAEEIGQKSTTIISQGELAKNKHFNIEQLYRLSIVLECNICDFFYKPKSTKH
jgi:transcriptional regulator with XRE-family HTH domain